MSAVLNVRYFGFRLATLLYCIYYIIYVNTYIMEYNNIRRLMNNNMTMVVFVRRVCCLSLSPRPPSTGTVSLSAPSWRLSSRVPVIIILLLLLLLLFLIVHIQANRQNNINYYYVRVYATATCPSTRLHHIVHKILDDDIIL